MERSESATTAATAVESNTQYFRRILSQVLLQEIATGRYYQGAGIWSSDAAGAVKFRTDSAARECATRLNLTNVQVVITHEFRECQIFPFQNKLVRVWPAEPSETQLCPGGLRTPFSVLQIHRIGSR